MWRESLLQVLVVVNYEAERIEKENRRLAGVGRN